MGNGGLGHCNGFKDKLTIKNCTDTCKQSTTENKVHTENKELYNVLLYESYCKWKQVSVSGGVDQSVDLLNSMNIY